MAVSLSVLVPAYNERDDLAPTVETLLKALNVSIGDFEVLVVDDGSTDGTAEVADRLATLHPSVHVVHNPTNRGLGASYAVGLQIASKDFFVFIPADNTFHYRALLSLFGNFGSADVLTSYPTNPEVRPWGRRVISRCYTILLNLLFGRHLRYYNGLTILPTSFLRSIRIRSVGFAYMAEVLLTALHAGLSFAEIALPIGERASGRSKALRPANLLGVPSMILAQFWRLRVRPTRRAAETPALAPASRGDGPPGLTIVLAGASQGIGAALTEALARDGHTLFVCARRSEHLDRVTQGGTLARWRPCDISDEEQVRAFFEWVGRSTTGVDALINCAADLRPIGPTLETDSNEWFQGIRTNLFGAYLMMKYALPLLARSRRPRIINFAGGGAFAPRPHHSAYGCSKAALVRLTETLSVELAAKGIMVNAVAPGFVSTEHHQATLAAGPERAGGNTYRRTQLLLKEGGVPMNVPIDCVRFLLSPEADGLTGKSLSANFDPWRSTAFRQHIPDITRSALYSVRRVNIIDLPEGPLRQTLLDELSRLEGDPDTARATDPRV